MGFNGEDLKSRGRLDILWSRVEQIGRARKRKWKQKMEIGEMAYFSDTPCLNTRPHLGSLNLWEWGNQAAIVFSSDRIPFLNLHFIFGNGECSLHLWKWGNQAANVFSNDRIPFLNEAAYFCKTHDTSLGF